MHWTEIFRYIFLLGAVNAYFFSFLIFSKKQKSFSDKLLATWLIVLAMQLAYPFFYLINIEKLQQLMGYEGFLFIYHPVFLFLYAKSMTGKLELDRKLKIQLISAVLVSILFFIYRLFTPIEGLDFLKAFNLPKGLPIKFIIITLIVLILILYVFILFFYKTFKVLGKFKKNILQVFSYHINIDLIWLQRLTLYFTFSFFFSILCIPILYKLDLSIGFIDYIFYALLVKFVFLLGYWGYQQGEIFRNQDIVLLQDEKLLPKHYVNGFDKSAIDYKKEALELKRLVEKEQPYLNPSLTIHDLSQMINIPVHQLSKIINKEFGKNFFEFINEYRIESFKKYIQSNEFKNFTILGVALECGFNSKSAFNRIFKEQTGLTPGDFKKKHCVT